MDIRTGILESLKTPPVKNRSKEHAVGEVNLERLTEQLIALFNQWLEEQGAEHWVRGESEWAESGRLTHEPLRIK